MIASEGVITGAGFETPAEALYLGKKLLCLPIRGQYEQLCNAAALKNFGVTIVDKMDNEFTGTIASWLSSPNPT
ncbi:glycosyltransferase family protein, partial [Acinetobacter baumannii]